MENHYEEVKIVPEPFINLARSEVSEAQLIGIPEKPVYGMAFHPERCTGNANRQTAGECDGRRILTNFLKMACDKQR
jgi:GMP synthase (glutamine-hydrolysing)